VRRIRLRVNGQWYEVEVGDVYQSPVEVMVDGSLYLVELEGATDSVRRQALPSYQVRKVEQPGLRGIIQGNDKVIRCPLPGKVIAITATKGQEMEPGDEICVLESMKMEQSVRMAQRGLVKSVKIKRNQNLNTGAPLLELQ
jgi:acetyl/propionyl-CoA carboxylase alpha subunit